MIPMRTSSIFRSRWMALIWAAGILWLAWDVAGSAPSQPSATAKPEQTDATGAAITSDDQERLEQALNGL